MNYQTSWTSVRGEAASGIHPTTHPTEPQTEVFHEGQHVRIRLNRMLKDRAIMIPLRNGFPLHASDRTAQCFSVIDAQGWRVGVAVRLPEFGLRMVFDRPPPAGDYYIRTQTQVGRA